MTTIIRDMSSFTDSVVTALLLISNFDHGLLTIVSRSLAVSGTACALASGLGLVLGAWLGGGALLAAAARC